MSKVVWCCEICGSEAETSFSFDNSKADKDCSSSIPVFIWLPQGWRKSEFGIICSSCSDSIYEKVEALRCGS